MAERIRPRAVKRVATTFTWPSGQTWAGYVNPWPGPVACTACLTTGLDAETLRLALRFQSWARRLTKAESAEMTRQGFSAKELENLKKGIASSDMQRALVEIRARRKGHLGECVVCAGSGFAPNPNPAVISLYHGVDLYESWIPTDPPAGEGWQVWDGADGAPLSPVCASASALAAWCVSKYKGSYDYWIHWIESFSKISLITRAPAQPHLYLPSDRFQVLGGQRSQPSQSN